MTAPVHHVVQMKNRDEVQCQTVSLDGSGQLSSAHCQHQPDYRLFQTNRLSIITPVQQLIHNILPKRRGADDGFGVLASRPSTFVVEGDEEAEEFPTLLEYPCVLSRATRERPAVERGPSLDLVGGEGPPSRVATSAIGSAWNDAE